MQINKKTILFLDQYSALSGGQKVLVDIVQYFFSKGYKPIVVLPEKGLLTEKLDSLEVEYKLFPIGYYSITKKNIFDLINYFVRIPVLTFLLIYLIKKNKAGIVYANGARTFVWATLACLVTNTPLFWHIHSIFSKGLTRKTLLFFGRFSIVRKIFVVSRAAAEPLWQHRKKLEIVYNAINIPSITSNNNQLKVSYKLKLDSVLIGSVGILEEWKNQEDLICAAKVIKENGFAKVYFFIIGDSLYKGSKNQLYKEKLKKIVSDFGLEKTVFFTGFREDVYDIINCLDLMVICSKDPDPCPLVSLEAAYLGKALISTRSGGVKEIFQEKEHALFYSAGDINGLVEQITILLNNKRMMEDIASRAKLKVSRDHRLGDYLEKIISSVEKSVYG